MANPPHTHTHSPSATCRTPLLLSSPSLSSRMLKSAAGCYFASTDASAAQHRAQRTRGGHGDKGLGGGESRGKSGRGQRGRTCALTTGTNERGRWWWWWLWGSHPDLRHLALYKSAGWRYRKMKGTLLSRLPQQKHSQSTEERYGNVMVMLQEC